MKTFIKTFLAVTVFTLLCGTTAFAKTLNSSTIYFSEVESDENGLIYVAPSSCNNADITEYSFSGTWTPGKAVTFTVKLTANSGNNFSSKTSFKVSGANAKVTGSSIGYDTATVTVSVYPTVKLKAPEAYMASDYQAKWKSVKYAGSYELQLVINNGEKETSKKITVTGTTCDLSQYATGTNEVTFQIRALPSKKTKKYVTASAWSVCGETVYASSDNTSQGTLSGSGSGMTYKTDSDKNATGWQYINGYWYYFTPAGSNRAMTGWADIDGKKYYFNTSGQMQKGWNIIDNQWYYFCEEKGARLGEMLTGWIKCQDYWFYCTTSADAKANPSRKVGSLYMDCKTPDGQTVGKDGKWLGY